MKSTRKVRKNQSPFEPRILLYGTVLEYDKEAQTLLFRAAQEQPHSLFRGAAGLEFRFPISNVTPFSHEGKPAAMVPVRSVRKQLNEIRKAHEQKAMPDTA